MANYIRDAIRRVAADCPKTELHLHLDGSLPPSWIMERAAARGLNCPRTPEALRSSLHEMKSEARRVSRSANPQAAGKNWGVFDWCNRFLQTEEELRSAAKAICDSCAKENVLHTEIRFCPTLHTLEGLSASDALQAVAEGVRDSNCASGGVIVCALRSHRAEHGLAMADLAEEYHKAGIVIGFDLAGDEGSYPLELHRSVIERCKRGGVPVTVHAGEWPGTAQNVALALDLGVDRIGHGWSMANDKRLMERAAESGTLVEVCLTSNVKPHNEVGWIRSYQEHPVRTLFDAGVNVALSSDNLLLSGSAQRIAGPTAELVHLVADCSFTWTEAAQILRNGASGAFIHSKGEREAFLSRFDAAMSASEKLTKVLSDEVEKSAL